MKLYAVLASVALAAGVTSAYANDGFSGLTAGGLEFQNTDAVEMRSEDLFISPSEVRVTYVFHNSSARDVEGMVTFPMPPLSPGDKNGESPTATEIQQAKDINVFGFTAKVDGREVRTDIETRFLLKKPDTYAWGWDILNGAKDITPMMRSIHAPETYDDEAIDAWFKSQPAPRQEQLKRDNVWAPIYEEGKYLPAYALSTRYFWRQTFPAGRDVRIEHRYHPIQGGSVFYMNEDLKRDYCIDGGTERAILALQRRAENSPKDKQYDFPIDGVQLTFLDYILMTANTWKGPIGQFRLTLDKESPDRIMSLCIDGVRKTGPTTFVVERQNFRPERDLKLVFVNYIKGQRQ